MAAASSELALTTIGQIAVPVHDLERAVRFYRDTLGMRLLFQAPNLAFFDVGGVRLMLSMPESAEFDHPASVIYYKVASIHAAFEALRARGVAFEDTPHVIARLDTHDLWLAFFRDSERNLLALMAEVPR
jgi:catechol 2,3-dioxygenase-like lactoylglutathione lyase family enzyme